MEVDIVALGLISLSSSYSHPGWNANTLLLPIDITLAQTRIPSTPLTEKLFCAEPLSQLNTQLNTQAHISHSCCANMQMTNTVFPFGSPVLWKQFIYRLSPALTLVFYGAELLLKGRFMCSYSVELGIAYRSSVLLKSGQWWLGFSGTQRDCFAKQQGTLW